MYVYVYMHICKLINILMIMMNKNTSVLRRKDAKRKIRQKFTFKAPVSFL